MLFHGNVGNRWELSERWGGRISCAFCAPPTPPCAPGPRLSAAAKAEGDGVARPFSVFGDVGDDGAGAVIGDGDVVMGDVEGAAVPLLSDGWSLLLGEY